MLEMKQETLRTATEDAREVIRFARELAIAEFGWGSKDCPKMILQVAMLISDQMKSN